MKKYQKWNHFGIGVSLGWPKGVAPLWARVGSVVGLVGSVVGLVGLVVGSVVGSVVGLVGSVLGLVGLVDSAVLLSSAAQ